MVHPRNDRTIVVNQVLRLALLQNFGCIFVGTHWWLLLCRSQGFGRTQVLLVVPALLVDIWFAAAVRELVRTLALGRYVLDIGQVGLVECFSLPLQT